MTTDQIGRKALLWRGDRDARESENYDRSKLDPTLREIAAKGWVSAHPDVILKMGTKDADFLYGPRTEAGEDTYVLCEINVSAVFPFPGQAIAKIAQAAMTSLLSARKARIPTKV